MENFSPSVQGFPQGISWCVDILTKITKNCMKIAKRVFFFGKIVGEMQFMRGDRPNFGMVCSMQAKTFSSK